MRNRLIHVYFDIDVDRVWDTISDDLPPLITVLERILNSET
ncbi:MAG: HepT-like ribonuclease domain-containing protein [Thermodesulfobacteriota bacterium]